jgi:predicted PhzF superfamily epimerase YddE/YHI9
MEAGIKKPKRGATLPIKKFYVVDVFSLEAYKGNPVMIVMNADDLDTARMQSFAAWNGMPETVYLRRTAPGDDCRQSEYTVRIFSPCAELGFAGHPSLGAAHIALEIGLVQPDLLIAPDSEGFDGAMGKLRQHCAVGDAGVFT